MRVGKITSVMVLALALLIAGSLSALAQEQIVLTVLEYFDATNPNAAREIEEVWNEFARRNPDIRIEKEDLYLEPFHQKLAAYVASGQLPDVIRMWPGGRSSALHHQRLVKDLEPFIEPTGMSISRRRCSPRPAGYLAMIPEGITATHVIYTNTKLLADLGLSIPKTYDELKAMAPTLRRAGLEPVITGAAGRLGDPVDVLQHDPRPPGRRRFHRRRPRRPSQVHRRAVLEKPPLFQATLRRRRPQPDASSRRPTAKSTALFAAGRSPFMIDGIWKVGNFLTDPTTGEALIPPAEQEHIELLVFPRHPGRDRLQLNRCGGEHGLWHERGDPRRLRQRASGVAPDRLAHLS